MINAIGYWLSGAIALGIVLIGVRFFLAPHAAAVAFGVPVRPDAHWEAYHIRFNPRWEVRWTEGSRRDELRSQ
jgi:hypothetical protein